MLPCSRIYANAACWRSFNRLSPVSPGTDLDLVNRTMNELMSEMNSGSGIPRDLHDWIIRRVPVPQCSIRRALCIAMASLGSRGRDGLESSLKARIAFRTVRSEIPSSRAFRGYKIRLWMVGREYDRSK